MVRLIFESQFLRLEVQGLHKLWAFKGSIDIPFECIDAVRVDPEIARPWWKGWRIPGTQIPGVITAGTYYKNGQRVFWDVADPARALVIDLKKHKYNQVIIEVENPNEAAEKIGAILDPQPG